MRCEALLCCGNRHHPRGSQCQSIYTELSADGRHWLCWLHRSAAANQTRNMPLEYVQNGPDLAPLLERSVRLAGGEP